VYSDTHYCSGEDIRVGDRIMHGPWRAEVVFVLASHSFSEGFREEDWSFLGKGFMINSEAMGLMHCETADEDTTLIGRG
jgi:hypothetical protein